MDKKLDTTSTLRNGLRDQNHFCTRLRRDDLQLSIVIGLHKSSDVLFHKMLSSSNQCNQSIIIVLNTLLIVLPERAP
jgi:hypothetical protein